MKGGTTRDVVTILGIRRVDFVTEDGVNINGLSLYYSYHDDGVDGVAADKVFVADRHLTNIKLAVGDNIKIFFTRKGYVAGVEVADEVDL